MIMQVQTHLGATGTVNNKYLTWKKKAAVEHKWAPKKKHFCAVISEVEKLNKLTTGKASLAAIAARNVSSLAPTCVLLRPFYSMLGTWC